MTSSQGSYSNSTNNQKTGFISNLLNKLVNYVKWLLTKEGRPILLVIAVGFLVGAFVDGAVGLILSTIIGLALLMFLKKFHLPLKPWQATVKTLMPIIARLCFVMILLLPVASAEIGLLLPSGHYPDTFMKYLSIMIVVPSNIVSNAPVGDIFPGIPIIVALSIILMFWGSLNLYKKKNFLIAFAGLFLYTISPVIAGAAVPVHVNPVYSSYAIGYYIGWIGLALVIVDKYFLNRILKIPAAAQPKLNAPRTSTMLSIVPIVGLTLFLTQLQFMHVNWAMVFQDMSPGFEAAHHGVASFFTGVVAAVGADVIITEVATSSDSTSNPPDQPTPPEVQPTPPVQQETPPQTTDQPEDPEEIKQRLEQEKINKQYMSDFEKDRQQDISKDRQKAIDDDKALHDMQEHAHDETKKFWKDYYEHENEFNSWEAEHENQKAEGFEKLEHAAQYTKKGADWLIWVGKYTVPGGRKVADIYEVTSEFAEGAAEGGFKQGLEKGGIKVGEKVLEHFMWHGIEHKLGHESDAGKFIHYINEESEGPVHNLNDFAVEATKDKIKGLAPEQAGDYVKKKAGLEEGEEGGHEGGEGGEGGSEKGSEGASEGSSGSESSGNSEGSSSASSGSE